MTRAFLCETAEKSDTRRLLSWAVEQVWGIPCPQVRKLPSGKPYFPERPDLYFSLSHTSTHVMVALGDAPCGCDVERLRTVQPSVPKRVCGERELATLDFIECWVLKESFLKITGDVRMDFKTTNFARVNGVIVTPTPEVSAQLYPVPGCRAAVCCLDAPPERLETVPRTVIAEKSLV